MRRRLLTLLLIAAFACGLSFADDTAPMGSKQNPIKVSSVEMERIYCKFLRTSEGEEIQYDRVGSVGKGPYGNILDWYKVTTKDGKREWDIYIDMYHKDAQTIPQVAPPGLLTLQQYTALRLKGKRKDYIGLSLPTGSQFTPLVAATPDGALVVTRVVPKPPGRDVEVLVGDGRSWSTLGDFGGALVRNTEGYAGVGNLRWGPENKLWIGAGTSSPDRSMLYRLDGQKWHLISAGERIEASTKYWSGAICFGDDGKIFGVNVEQKGGLSRAVMEEGLWRDVPIPKRIMDIKPPPTARSDWMLQGLADNFFWFAVQSSQPRDAFWMFWNWDCGTKTLISALAITGTGENDFLGPVDLVSVGPERYVQCTAFATNGVIALNITDGSYDNGELYLVSSPDGWKRVVCRRAATMEGDSEFDDMQWSPAGQLYACRLTKTNSVDLLRLDGQEWQVTATHAQPEEDPRIFDARIFFKHDHTPVVVWADMFR